jgi:hypothetical protein
MSHKFYMLWDGPDGKGWSGPHSEIDDAKRAVPDSATASMLATPLIAMTPSEKREALPILKGRQP